MPGVSVVIWASLGPQPITTGEFWTEVFAAAVRAGLLDEPSSRAMGRDARSGMVDLQEVAARLTARGRCLLAIDGYEPYRPDHRGLDAELVALSAAHPLLRLAVTTRAPEQLRKDPPLALAGLPSGDARHTLSEALQVVEQVSDVPMPRHRAEGVQGRAAGPARGLRIDPGFGGQSRFGATGGNSWQPVVNTILHSDLWKVTDPAFAAMTILPPYLDAVLAAQITDFPVERVEGILEDLEWHGYGERHTLSDGTRAFTYSEPLRDRIRRQVLQNGDPQEVARAGRLSLAWLREMGDPESAFLLALELGMYDDAAAAYMELMALAPSRYNSPDLVGPLSAIPAAVYCQEPVLAFAHAVSLLSDPILTSAAPPYLELVAPRARALKHRPGRPVEKVIFELMLAAVSLRLLDRHLEATRFAREATKLLVRGDEVDLGPAGTGLRRLMVTHLSFCLIQAGDFELAESMLTWAISTSRTPGAKAELAVSLLFMEVLNGRVHRASTLVERFPVRQALLDSPSTFLVELGRLGIGALHMEELDLVAGLAELADTPDQAHGPGELWMYRQCLLLHARLAKGEGHQEALRILDDAALLSHPAAGQSLGGAALLNTVAIGLLTGGEHTAVRRVLAVPTDFPGQLAPAVALAMVLAGDSHGMLERLTELVEQAGHTIRSRMALDMIAAAGALRERDLRLAETLLRAAARAHETHGLRLPLLYLPAQDLAALREHGARLGVPGWAGPPRVKVPSPRFVNSRIVPLTEREQAVAAALLVYPTREQIAEALYVSPNTVKTQLRSIYRKLEVHSRRDAVERIIELGLHPNLPQGPQQH